MLPLGELHFSKDGQSSRTSLRVASIKDPEFLSHLDKGVLRNLVRLDKQSNQSQTCSGSTSFER